MERNAWTSTGTENVIRQDFPFPLNLGIFVLKLHEGLQLAFQETVEVHNVLPPGLSFPRTSFSRVSSA